LVISVAATPLAAWVDEEEEPWRTRTGESCATAGNRSARRCMRRLGFPVNGLPTQLRALISLSIKSRDRGQLVDHASTDTPPWAGSDSGKEGRFSGT